MQTTIARKSLLSALQTVARAVPRRTPKTILRNVRIEANGSLVVTGTDQEKTAVATVDCQTTVDGTILASAESLTKSLKSLKSEYVSLSADVDGNCTLTSDGCSMPVLRCDGGAKSVPADFPAVDSRSDASKVVSFGIAAGELRQALTATLFCCDVDSTRYALGGAKLEIMSKYLAFVSTDSRRLSLYYATADLPEGSALPVETIVPHAALKALLASLPKNPLSVVSVHVGDNDIAFSFNGIVIRSRYLEGRFPRYLDVVPPKGEHVLVLPVASVLSAVKTAALATDESHRGIDFQFSTGRLTLRAHNGAKTVVSFNHETETELTLDPRFVIDFLESLKGTAEVEMHIIDHESAVKFHAGDALTYVLMPLARDRR